MTQEQEEARLEQAMQRGDELLVNSLKTEDRRRSRTRTLAIASITLIVIVGACLIAIWPSTPHDRPTNVAVMPATQRARSGTHVDFAADLTSLNDDNWRRAFAIGSALAKIDSETSWPILEKNWSKIPNLIAFLIAFMVSR